MLIHSNCSRLFLKQKHKILISRSLILHRHCQQHARAHLIVMKRDEKAWSYTRKKMFIQSSLKDITKEEAKNIEKIALTFVFRCCEWIMVNILCVNKFQIDICSYVLFSRLFRTHLLTARCFFLRSLPLRLLTRACNVWIIHWASTSLHSYHLISSN
jgi:hypothetical protein